MPVYAPVDAFTPVVTGVHETDIDDAWDQDEGFEDLARLHPAALLAHREEIDNLCPAETTRVRWTVPGIPRRPDPAWWACVVTTLGRLDVDGHLRLLEHLPTSSAPGRIKRAPDADPQPRAGRYPARAPALTITGIADFVVTDRGLWITRVPSPPATVPLGYNLAACLATAPGRDTTIATVDAALDAYRLTACTALAGRIDRSCACGRTADEHLPTAEQFRHYIDNVAAYFAGTARTRSAETTGRIDPRARPRPQVGTQTRTPVLPLYGSEDTATGVDTVPIAEERTQSIAGDAMRRLHPGVCVAQRTTLTTDPVSGLSRVRWTAPGAACDRGDPNTWAVTVPTTLGYLDEETHATLAAAAARHRDAPLVSRTPAPSCRPPVPATTGRHPPRL